MLFLSGNHIGTNGNADIINLKELQSVSVLDLSNNRISSDSNIEDVLTKMKSLKVLYLKDNAIAKEKDYRKKYVVLLPNLTYFDESPITSAERRLSLAYFEGGREAEDEMRRLIKVEETQKKDAERRNFNRLFCESN
ncbi:leucine rich repeat-containing protein [Cardiosporidium cionae]|uniref:Leucine rich repeat-containing protein n=1 Tax=Cardiosporidium cionae TaxID=476202 RepID=A0ABQ7J8R0_9APIC|nr:leucine rich repeat-containing protein [Cardiosporidium cionae]|eukprot:KAF8820354.1 leucine rich repeat-containing protein [Cardiosporidium cionae]